MQTPGYNLTCLFSPWEDEILFTDLRTAVAEIGVLVYLAGIRELLLLLNLHSPRVVLPLEIQAISWSRDERRGRGQESAPVQGLWQREAVPCCPTGDLRSGRCPDWGGPVLWRSWARRDSSPAGARTRWCELGFTFSLCVALARAFSLVPDQADGARAAGYSGVGELLPLLFVFNKKSLSCRGWHRVCTKILGLMDQQLPGKPFKPFSVSSILDAFRFLPVKLWHGRVNTT